MIVDDYKIKLEVIKLAIMKHTGREIKKELLNRFCKYLTMEYENNTSKNSIDNRINSICKTINTKYDKYMRIINAKISHPVIIYSSIILSSIFIVNFIYYPP